ncbi:MAG TPA: helix-hairpin-helix domain-containing protein [Anaerolineales bacterium]|nr:helix-hairpin-helix domain-containing protein [Anaerolineales bacterium]
MSDFLNFLNTADIETLTNIQGITHPVARNITAARPFISVDDCLKVKGMGKSLLIRMQSFAEAQDDNSENIAMIPAEGYALPVPIGKNQPAQESVKDQPSFLTRLGRAFANFLRVLLRLVILVLVIGGIGAGLYYGLRYINKTLITLEKNTARVGELDDEVANLQIQLNEMNSRVDIIETSVETRSASLDKLEKIQATLEAQIKENNDKSLRELKYEVMMTRALDMLGRARLYLAQSNFGLAKVDVQSARDLLFELQTETGDDMLLQVIARLDLALGNLPAFPVVASGDLEIAWQILMGGGTPMITAPEPTLGATPTATP